MAIESLDNYYYWKAIIYWKPPRKWHKDDKYKGVERRNADRNEYGIYRFERRQESQKGGSENFYIGIAYRQDFDKRLHQGYHKWMLKNMKRGQEIWVSFGIIKLKGKGTKHTRKRYEEIEAMLIYFTQPKKNDRKRYWCREGWYYEIKNNGYRGPLPKCIKYPVAEIIK